MNLDFVSLTHLSRFEHTGRLLGAQCVVWKLHLYPGHQTEMLL